MHCTSFAYIAFKHGKDAKTVHNGLAGVFFLHYTPNLTTIYLWFEDMRRHRNTLRKSTQPSRPCSAGTPLITQSAQKMAYNDFRMSVRDLSYNLRALLNF